MYSLYEQYICVDDVSYFYWRQSVLSVIRQEMTVVVEEEEEEDDTRLSYSIKSDK